MVWLPTGDTSYTDGVYAFDIPNKAVMCGQWMDVEAASGSEKRESAAPSSPISGGDTEGSASVLDVSNKAKEE